MRTAVVTVIGNRVDVNLSFPQTADEGEESVEEVPESDLNPIFPELKEIVWGFGSFIVLAVAMRYFLYPRLRKGMDARYGLIRSGHEQAEQITASAQGDVVDYESQLAAAKTDATKRVDAARAILEAERADRLAEVNARMAERRAAALAEVESARAAVQSDVESAVRDVAAEAGRLATGRVPDPQVVAAAVTDVLSAGANR